MSCESSIGGHPSIIPACWYVQAAAYSVPAASLHYLPLDSTTSGSAAITADAVRLFRRRGGVLRNVVLHLSATTNPGITTIGFHLNQIVIPVTTISINCNVPDARFVFDFAPIARWSATDQVHIGITPTIATTARATLEWLLD